MKKLGIVIFCCVVFAVPRISAQIAWDLSQDLGNASNQISLNQGSNQTWYLMESATRTHDPTGYRFLTEYLAPCQSSVTGDTVTGVGCWHGTAAHINDLSLKPEIAFNFTDQILDPNEVYPGYLPHSLLMSPNWERYAIVAWRSPFTGVVNLKGAFGWRNLLIADVVLWSLDKGNQTLKSGTLWAPQPRGNLTLSGLPVVKDDVLYFIVDDPNYEACYCAKPVDLRVTITRVK